MQIVGTDMLVSKPCCCLQGVEDSAGYGQLNVKSKVRSGKCTASFLLPEVAWQGSGLQSGVHCPLLPPVQNSAWVMSRSPGPRQCAAQPCCHLRMRTEPTRQARQLSEELVAPACPLEYTLLGSARQGRLESPPSLHSCMPQAEDWTNLTLGCTALHSCQHSLAHVG